MGDRGPESPPTTVNAPETSREARSAVQEKQVLAVETGRHDTGRMPHNNAMTDAMPFFSQMPNQQTMAHPSEHQPLQGSRQENFTYSQAYPSPFTMGHMANALPAQPQSMSQNQWSSPTSPHSPLHPGALSQRRQSDHTYPHPQQAYYPDYNVSQNYIPHQYLHYPGQYVHGQTSQGYIPVRHQHHYQLPPHSQAYNNPLPPYYTTGQPQPYTFNSPGPAPPLRPGQLGYPIGLSGISSRSTADDQIHPASSRSDSSSLRLIPRGPPRKPRQSGHALWVGNLPPGTTVIDLKDHFSREATKDIESLKLISKSNCAFVNYRSHAACAAAMERFHDSRFHGTKLVCRLRRTTPVSPGSSSQPLSPGTDEAQAEALDDENTTEQHLGTAAASGTADKPPSTAEGLPERFFVLKSLTLQDLEVSTRTGVWATQAHNEEALNRAYETSENVYLFFSANKSGEYFGYARMASKIGTSAMSYNTGDSSSSGSVKNTQFAMETPPKAIPTVATEWAPKGRIIDDMARGTIFWEAVLDGDDDEGKGEGTDPTESAVHSSSAGTSSPVPQEPAIASSTSVSSPSSHRALPHDPSEVEEGAAASPGQAFQVEWLSVKKLPFYKCRGLRNPWNSNREVKIARDGTELETSVGKRLMTFFGSPAAYAPR